MTTIACPQCAGLVWVRDGLVAASDPTGDLRLTRTATPGPLRWTCAGCGYQAPHGGMLSWRLGGAPVAHEEPVAAAGRSR